MNNTTTKTTTAALTMTTTIKAGKMTIQVTNASRTALGAVIKQLRDIRKTVRQCSPIVWLEDDETRAEAFGRGVFTAGSIDKDSLEVIARRLVQALQAADDLYRSEHAGRVQREQERQLEWEQRQVRREEQTRRAEAIAKRRAEAEEMAQYQHHGSPLKLGDAPVRLVPGAPRVRKFRSAYPVRDYSIPEDRDGGDYPPIDVNTVRRLDQEPEFGSIPEEKKKVLEVLEKVEAPPAAEVPSAWDE